VSVSFAALLYRSNWEALAEHAVKANEAHAPDIPLDNIAAV
jgi:hypothetical protein